MIMGMEYGATQSPALRRATAITVLVLVGCSLTIFLGLRAIIPVSPTATVGISLAPLALGGLAALFTIRGYVLTRDTLFVRRLLWSTAVHLDDLLSVKLDPEAMEGAERLVANDRCFAIAGSFHTPRLGRFQAYVTDRDRTIVIRLKDRVIVVSPDDPDAFVRHATSFIPPPTP